MSSVFLLISTKSPGMRIYCLNSSSTAGYSLSETEPLTASIRAVRSRCKAAFRHVVPLRLSSSYRIFLVVIYFRRVSTVWCPLLCGNHIYALYPSLVLLFFSSPQLVAASCSLSPCLVSCVKCPVALPFHAFGFLFYNNSQPGF